MLGSFTQPTSAQNGSRETRPIVAVTAIVDHSSIDAMRQGIEDSLNSAGYAPGDGVTITFESAEADLDRANAIARSLQHRQVSLVIALSEPSARSVAAQAMRVPVVIAGMPIAVADEIAANNRARLLTGVGQGDPNSALISLVATLRPEAKTVIVPYRATSGAEPTMMRELSAAARTHPFVVRGLPIADDAGDTDFLPADLNRATSVMLLVGAAVGERADALIHEAAGRALPVVADRRDLVVRGATAAVIHDFYSIGRQAGTVAADILRDPSRARQPIQRADARFLVVNAEAASDPRLQLAIDPTDIANEIIAWAEPNGPNPVIKPHVPASEPAPAVPEIQP